MESKQRGCPFHNNANPKGEYLLPGEKCVHNSNSAQTERRMAKAIITKLTQAIEEKIQPIINIPKGAVSSEFNDLIDEYLKKIFKLLLTLLNEVQVEENIKQEFGAVKIDYRERSFVRNYPNIKNTPELYHNAIGIEAIGKILRIFLKSLPSLLQEIEAPEINITPEFILEILKNSNTTAQLASSRSLEAHKALLQNGAEKTRLKKDRRGSYRIVFPGIEKEEGHGCPAIGYSAQLWETLIKKNLGWYTVYLSDEIHKRRLAEETSQRV